MATQTTDPKLFNDGIEGFTTEVQFDSYYAAKNGERANESNIGRAPKRVKKELNIIRDFMSALFNRPVKEFDISVAYQYGEIVSIKTTQSPTVVYYKYYVSQKNDNLGVSPSSVENATSSYWDIFEPFGTFKNEFNEDMAFINDVGVGANKENSGYLIVGERYGQNVTIDRDEIMSRIWNTQTKMVDVHELTIQSDGGDLLIHKNNHTTDKNGIVFKDNGYVGIRTLTPQANLHMIGNSFIIEDESSNIKQFKITSDGSEFVLKTTNETLQISSSVIKMNPTAGSVQVGGDNGLLSTLGVRGTLSIKRNVGNVNSEIFTIQDKDTPQKISVGSQFIESKNGTTNTALMFQKDGGAICIHGNVVDKTTALSITDSGSLVIGKNLCSTDTMTDTANKLEVHGDVLFSKGLKGLKDLVLGENSGSDILKIWKKEPNFYIDALKNNGEASTLYVQSIGLDTIFNNGTACGGNTNNYVHITDCGNVGIGMLNPDCRLKVDGTACISGKTTVGGDFVLKTKMFFNEDTISSITGATLYIQRTIAGKSLQGDIIFCGDTADVNSIRFSLGGKASFGSSDSISTQSERLKVVGASTFNDSGELTFLKISPYADRIELATGDNTSMFIMSGDSDNIYVLGNTNTELGGKFIVGSNSEILNEFQANFRSEFNGATCFNRNQTTTNGDTQKNFMDDTEVVRVRRTQEEYLRLGGDYVQAVLGVDTDSDMYSTARESSVLRIQPYGGMIQLGDATTPTTRVTMRTRGVIEATLFDGVATSAQYADLAERYEADTIYEEGTILCVGGDKEVTLGNIGMALAGIVSTSPAYRMNDKEDNRRDDMPFIALKGRVPCKVNGTVKKGQYIVLDKDGKGKGVNIPENPYTVVGVAISDSIDGMVEVKV